jgi:hypothetical protein
MMLRPARYTAVATALAVLLVGFTAPSTAGGALPTPADQLPPCPPGGPGAGSPAVAPPTVPSIAHPTACRARATRVEPVGAGRLPTPRPGYHHLGATTAGEWSGILGRLTVRDPGLRGGSFDFVAARFMAKRGLADGRLAWLEVGWAETGWSGDGAQRVYTFDSEAMSWVFYEEYALRDGDQIWVYLHSGAEGERTVWQAWLWWGERWRLLAARELPMGGHAQLEQYVEVYQDPDRTGPPVSVPPIGVDNVGVAAPGRPPVSWRAETVATLAPTPAGDYCLEWVVHYDTWSAGDCAVTVQE